MIIHTSQKATLYLGDALSVMENLDPGSVDVIFADPPYNLSNDGITCRSGKMASVNKAAWDKSRGTEADFAFHAAWIAACRRVLADTGTLWISGTYHSIYACGHALQKGGWRLLNDIVWYKPNASPNLSCRMFTASHETLLWAKKSPKARHYFDYAAMREGEWDNDFLKKPGRQMRSVWAITAPLQAEKNTESIRPRNRRRFSRESYGLLAPRTVLFLTLSAGRAQPALLLCATKPGSSASTRMQPISTSWRCPGFWNPTPAHRSLCKNGWAAAHELHHAAEAA